MSDTDFPLNAVGTGSQRQGLQREVGFGWKNGNVSEKAKLFLISQEIRKEILYQERWGHLEAKMNVGQFLEGIGMTDSETLDRAWRSFKLQGDPSTVDIEVKRTAVAEALRASQFHSDDQVPWEKQAATPPPPPPVAPQKHPWDRPVNWAKAVFAKYKAWIHMPKLHRGTAVKIAIGMVGITALIATGFWQDLILTVAILAGATVAYALFLRVRRGIGVSTLVEATRDYRARLTPIQMGEGLFAFIATVLMVHFGYWGPLEVGTGVTLIVYWWRNRPAQSLEIKPAWQFSRFDTNRWKRVGKGVLVAGGIGLFLTLVGLAIVFGLNSMSSPTAGPVPPVPQPPNAEVAQLNGQIETLTKQRDDARAETKAQKDRADYNVGVGLAAQSKADNAIASRDEISKTLVTRTSERDANKSALDQTIANDNKTIAGLTKERDDALAGKKSAEDKLAIQETELARLRKFERDQALARLRAIIRLKAAIR